MVPHTQRSLLLVVSSCVFASLYVARAEAASTADFLAVVDEMISSWTARSVHAGAAIRDEYRPFIPLLALGHFDDIESGLATGGLVPLPQDVERFNVVIRRDGASPIGEKDLAHQDSYVSARPATIGCLLDVASRVKSGPIEVTSLVRHLDYQNELRATNLNATTDVPTHTLGVAFDIAIVNTPLATVRELQDVLRRMSEAGDILVVAEREQLVFHVVPQPSKLGWYTDVYARAMNGKSWDARHDETRLSTATVITAIGALQPLPEWAAEWWAAENVPVDLPIMVHVDVDDLPAIEDEPVRRNAGFGLLGGLLSTTWRWLSPFSAG